MVLAVSSFHSRETYTVFVFPPCFLLVTDIFFSCIYGRLHFLEFSGILVSNAFWPSNHRKEKLDFLLC